MKRLNAILVAIAALALVLTGASQSAQTGAKAQTRVKKLYGTVGPGFTITLKKANGKRVRRVRRGRYTFVIKDKSAIHNFHLKGPGVNKVITSVAFTGTKATVVTLKKGTYTYVCDPHASIMHGTFKVV